MAAWETAGTERVCAPSDEIVPRLSQYRGGDCRILPGDTRRCWKTNICRSSSCEEARLPETSAQQLHMATGIATRQAARSWTLPNLTFGLCRPVWGGRSRNARDAQACALFEPNAPGGWRRRQSLCRRVLALRWRAGPWSTRRWASPTEWTRASNLAPSTLIDEAAHKVGVAAPAHDEPVEGPRPNKIQWKLQPRTLCASRVCLDNRHDMLRPDGSNSHCRRLAADNIHECPHLHMPPR